MTEKRIAKLLQADRVTPVALSEKGKTRIGVALPGAQGTTDLYLVHGESGARDLAQISHLIEQFLPGVLGVLELNRLACEGATTQRADMSAMLNVLATQSLDLALERDGKLRGKKTPQMLTQNGDVRAVMHQVHHEKNDSAWQKKLRPQVERAGGLESLDVRRNLTPAQLAALHTVEVSGVEYQVDTTESNLFVVQAFAKNVQPRLEATGKSAAQVLSAIIEAESQPGEPIKEALHRAVGVATKSLWPIR